MRRSSATLGALVIFGVERHLRRLNNLMASTLHSGCNAKLRRLLEARWGGVGSILMMHRVVEDKTESASPGLTITASFLDQALTVLRTAGVEVVSLKDLYRRVANGQSSAQRAVALTFDDGYRDNLTLALPILRKHQAPATIFVPSGAPDRAMDIWFLRLDRAVMSSDSLSLGEHGLEQPIPAATASDKIKAYARLAGFIYRDLRRNRALAETLLPKRVVSDEALLDDYFASWSELRTFAADPLITIGAHTVSHPVLGHLSEAEARREIVEGRRRLSDELDRSIDLFAYPYGGRLECGTREYELAARCGFELAVTSRYGGLHDYHGARPFRLPRKTFGGLRENLDAMMFDILGTDPAAQALGRASRQTRHELRWR